MKTALYLQRYDEEEFLHAQAVLDGGYIYSKTAVWMSESLAIKNLSEIEKTIISYTVSTLDSHKVVFETEFEGNKILAHIVIQRNGNINANINNPTGPEINLKFIDFLKEKLTVASGVSDKDIAVTFWHLTPNGPKAMTRKIAAPKWDSIQSNYAGETRTGLDALMSDFKPDKGGQLILLHGNPGAGKTYSLRALCQQWKSWCKINYILDPESLFGASSYFSSLILEGEEPDYVLDDDEDDDVEDKGKWRLLILEDTGELLSEDARARAGQGLSRLLNLVDGFIGQGLRVLVLITTNEELDKLHPAVAREGRCAAAIEFKDFTYKQAQEWAKEHNITIPVKDKYSLADLYAIYKGQHSIRVDLEEEKTPFGFRMPPQEVSAQKVLI